MRTYFHTGDIGDIIACLPTVRALGGGELVIGFRPDGQRETLKGGRFEALAPLLLAQPYVLGVRWSDAPGGDIDFSHFRSSADHGMNIANHQARFIGVEASNEPWLTVAPQRHGRPVIARSQRYHNPDFPWRRVLSLLREPLFVGLPHEHMEFCAEFGQVEFAPVRNLLDVARIIAGASVFVGNQSSPFWIAIGLGARTVQETWLGGRNSIIHRPGAYYPAFDNYDVDRVLR